MYLKKVQAMLTKAKVPGSMTGSTDRRVGALVLLSVSSRACREKVNSHLRIAIGVHLSYCGYLPSGPREQALWSGTKAEGIWSLLTNALSLVILSR